MATDTSGTRSLEADAELERTLDRLEVRMEALQFSMRTRLASPRFELWRHDLRETRETWFRLVDPDGQDPTPEGS
ncbi:hypothetical protein ACF1GT_35805 [Streptomyces sp. NPDC014636]|uniref:hypothetical protein n=1 Tax=Streptomyces sp. NPDC014636 TaxID=3364876 RepID=UPI0036F9F2A3